MNYGLCILDYGLWIIVYGLMSMDYELYYVLDMFLFSGDCSVFW